MDQNLSNQQPAPAQTGKSSDPMKMWVIILGVLVLAAAGFAVWQTMQVGSLGSKVSELESNSAQLQANNNSLQSELNTLKGDDTSSESGDTTSSETKELIAATDAYMRAPAARANAVFEYNVFVNKDGFARVGAGSPTGEGGGVAVWLKKVGDIWVPLLATQDILSQETIDLYGVPQSVLQQ